MGRHSASQSQSIFRSEHDLTVCTESDLRLVYKIVKT